MQLGFHSKFWHAIRSVMLSYHTQREQKPPLKGPLAPAFNLSSKRWRGTRFGRGGGKKNLVDSRGKDILRLIIHRA